MSSIVYFVRRWDDPGICVSLKSIFGKTCLVSYRKYAGRVSQFYFHGSRASCFHCDSRPVSYFPPLYSEDLYLEVVGDKLLIYPGDGFVLVSLTVFLRYEMFAPSSHSL